MQFLVSFSILSYVNSFPLSFIFDRYRVLPSLLGHCWLSDESIRPLKNWVLGVGLLVMTFWVELCKCYLLPPRPSSSGDILVPANPGPLGNWQWCITCIGYHLPFFVLTITVNYITNQLSYFRSENTYNVDQTSFLHDHQENSPILPDLPGLSFEVIENLDIYKISLQSLQWPTLSTFKK